MRLFSYRRIRSYVNGIKENVKHKALKYNGQLRNEGTQQRKMKILTADEIEAHSHHTLVGGAKGCLAGLIVSGMIFKLVPRRYPRLDPKRLTYSIRTALFITPPTFLTAISAELASNEFDEAMYGSGAESRDALEEYRRWKELSLTQKLREGVSNNRYQIIMGAWAASMWGSWHFVNRDKIMTTAQKAVQARMYAQFLTVGLLLASVGLSVYERKHNPDPEQTREDKRWERALRYAEEEQERTSKGITTAGGFASNEDRRNAKIFK